MKIIILRPTLSDPSDPNLGRDTRLGTTFLYYNDEYYSSLFYGG